MKRSAVPTAVLVAAALLVALLAYGVITKGTDNTLDDAVKRGDFPSAPDTSRKLPVLGDDSRSASLADYKGKIVVLNFWASWCDPCIEEAPALAAVQSELAKDGSGTVFGATYNDVPEKSQKFALAHQLTFPMVRDVGTKLAEQYGTKNLPETFVIDAKGRIVAISRGVVSKTFLDKAIAKAKAQA